MPLSTDQPRLSLVFGKHDVGHAPLPRPPRRPPVAPIVVVPLILNLTGGEFATGQRQTRTLRSGTLSIGRAPGNDWVLADPERYLSRTHCVINARDGRYVLTDLSANGIDINGARHETGRDRDIVLADGDELRLGSYVITVRETDDAPAAYPQGAQAEGSPLDIDPLDDPLGRAPDPAFHHPIAHEPTGNRADDPFDIAGEHEPRRADDDDDLFRGIAPSNAWQGAAQTDHADPLIHAFAAPKVIAPADLDDIDFDALIGDPTPAPPGLAPPRQQAAPPGGAAPGNRPADQPKPLAPPPAAPTGNTQAGLAAFLEGAGVTDLRLDTTDPEAALRAAGEVFRAMAGGLREVLMSRAAIKGEMRVEQTMIGARNNNALKFSATVDEAVTALLRPRGAGYMPPLAATQQAFADIKSHEMAVIAGVQTALLALLRRFDPDALEGRLARGMIGAVLPAARKARYWDEFRQTYGAISRDAEDDFQAAFGRVFAQAYAAQTRKD